MVCFHLVNEPNGFLSNWYLSKFVLEDLTFMCVEQYLMWKKAMIFDDAEKALKIMQSSDPADIKALGRNVTGFVESKWAAVRYDVAHNAIYAKFTQNEDLKFLLLNTDGEFAECAANDLVWGIGLGMNDVNRFNSSMWRGQNLLGFALQEVYCELLQNK